MYKFTAGTSLI
uniref:Uncharacterized protein n=1 Tax=Arundo donax TaxID=35708 RepID=A0A0A9EMH6_ARUDO